MSAEEATFSLSAKEWQTIQNNWKPIQSFLQSYLSNENSVDKSDTKSKTNLTNCIQNMTSVLNKQYQLNEMDEMTKRLSQVSPATITNLMDQIEQESKQQSELQLQVVKEVDVNGANFVSISSVQMEALVTGALDAISSFAAATDNSAISPLSGSNSSASSPSSAGSSASFASSSSKLSASDSSAADPLLLSLVSELGVQELLLTIPKCDVFSRDFAQSVCTAFSGRGEVAVLAALKQLKYWYNFSVPQFVICLRNLFVSVKNNNSNTSKVCALLNKMRDVSLQSMQQSEANLNINNKMRAILSNTSVYNDDLKSLVLIDAHAVYPTSVYRISSGLCLSSADESQMECVMSTSITTSIFIETGVLSIKNSRLSDLYGPLSRVVIIIDARVDKLYSQQIDGYFRHWNIDVVKLCFSGNECDKHIESVEQILTGLKQNSVKRNEPVLIVGGGVITDLGGFATALYHRNTPYVMLCTSIVSGIDAGPSPRTCCDGFGYKNMFGCYHPPILTVTDRSFFKSLKFGWIRHGIAEIIKMSVVKDGKLFALLEKLNTKLINTKFGTIKPENEKDALSNEEQDEVDQIIKKAMRGYVESEYGNLWETHQCRPHAYGHTWSPGFELASGMLHGHAVACGMGFGAYLAFEYDFIKKDEMMRVLTVINKCELSLWHKAMENVDLVWKAQTRMVEKRGGNLCAPVPKGAIGKCGYINELSKDDLIKYLNQYKSLVTTKGKNSFDRNGLGVDPHCVDVGLEDPSKVETMQNRYEKEIELLKAENAKLRKK